MESPTSSVSTPRRWRLGLAYEWAIVASAVTLIAFVLVAGSWTSRLDDTLYDAATSWIERPVRGDVVIVALDAESISTSGRWPWSRRDMAALVDRVGDAGPKALGLDLSLAEPDYRQPADDILLAKSLQQAAAKTGAPVVMSVTALHGRPLLPVKSIAGDAPLGHTSYSPDTDGVLRRADLAPRFAGETMPNMAVALLRAGKVLPHPDTAQNGEQLIAFAGPPGNIPQVSATAVMRGEIPASALQGKFVLIGVTAAGFTDSYVVPASVATGGKEMTGVEVTANLLNALLNGEVVRQPGKYVVGLISAAAILILLFVFYRVGPSISVYLMFATAILTPLLAVLLLKHAGVWFPPMSVAVSALIAYPLWSWKRLEAICHSLDEEIVQLEREHDNAPRAVPAGTVGFADYIHNRVELIRLNINYLRSARKFLSESLDGLPYAAFVIAPDGRLVVANQQALDLCKIDKAELNRKSLHEALSRIHLDQNDWRMALNQALAGNALKLRGADINCNEYEVAMATFCNDKSVVSGLIVVVEDVTELLQAQREREEALSFLSHDIRSPQNSIMALAELQRHDGMRKSEPDFVSNVETLARKTVGLAEDFLQLVRADSKQLNLSDYDFLGLLEDCVAEVEPQARAKGITIECSGTASGVPVEADRALLSRAIINLLVNAIKYSPADGRIAATCEVVKGEAICSIADSGPGIHPEDLPRLFKRFMRGQSVDAKATGAGLGLAFVDVVSRRHGGQPRVTSTLGQGAIFSIVLPLANA